jgi:subtilisin family serine protease
MNIHAFSFRTTARGLAAACAGLLLLASLPGSADAAERYLVRYDATAKDIVVGVIDTDPASVIHHEFDDLGVLAATLSDATVDSLLSLDVVEDVAEDPKRELFAQRVPYGIDMVHARDEWDINRDDVIDEGAATGAGIRVCITDTGIMADHEDLKDVTILAGRSFVGEDWAADRQGHGTHVAGTVAAMHNDTGVVGVSPGEVELIIADVFNDDGDGQASSTILAAAEWCADQGADIISMSLGGKIGLLADGYRALYEQGILIIAAAGNDGAPVFNFPAAYEEVVSVAAVDSDEVVADFSTFNTDVEVAGPGVQVESTYPLSNSLAVAGGPTYQANAIANADPDNTSVTGPLADGGTCNDLPAESQFEGNVVLCERGGATFRQKIDNAAAGGGVAAVIYNNAEGNFNGTYGDPCCSEIPAISLSQADGQDALNHLGTDGTVNVNIADTTAYAFLSGTSMATPHASGTAAVIWSDCAGLDNDRVRSHLAATTRESQADDLDGRDVYYGFGIVQVAEGVDALHDGVDEYDPAEGNSDGNNPANVECAAAAGAKASGGGWLDGEAGKVNFGFDVEATTDGGSGDLSLRDHGVDARVKISRIESVSRLDADCGPVPGGDNAVEITGEGSFNSHSASFRACAADNGEPGNGADRFYLECTAGCSYDTAQSAPDGVIARGNIEVETEGGSSSSSGGASTLVLDPLLMTDGVAGTLQVFTVRAFEAAGKPAAGTEIVVVEERADGTTATHEAVTGTDGAALLSLTLPLADVAYQALAPDADSNSVPVETSAE